MSAGRPAIAVDPGLRTGLAILAPDGSIRAGEAEWGEAFDVVRDYACLLGDVPAPFDMVVEAFVVTSATASKSAAPWSLEGIGVCRFIARRHGGTLKLQQAVEAKKFVTDDRLRSRRWHLATPGGHANDALRHLYLYLAHAGRIAVA